MVVRGQSTTVRGQSTSVVRGSSTSQSIGGASKKFNFKAHQKFAKLGEQTRRASIKEDRRRRSVSRAASKGNLLIEEELSPRDSSYGGSSSGCYECGGDHAITECPQLKNIVQMRDSKCFRLSNWAHVMLERLTLHPTGGIRLTWDALLLLIILYNFATIPFFWCFQYPMGTGFQIVSGFVDFVFVLDIIVNSRTAVEEKSKSHGHHEVIRSTRKIMRGYLLKTFWFDVLAVVPLFDQDLAPFKLVKVIRLTGLGPLARKLDELKLLDYFKGVFWLIGFPLLAHLAGCGWAGVNVGTTYFEEEDIYDIEEKYFHCLYTGELILFAKGSKQAPNSNMAYFYCFMLFFFGSLFYAILISNMSLLVTNLDRANVAYRQKMRQVNDDLENLSLPKDLSARIRLYFDVMWTHNRSSFLGYSVIQEVSQGLQVEVLVHKAKDTLLKVPFLMNCQMEFLLHLATKLHTELFMAGELLFIQGDAGDCMYFIEDGDVEVYNEASGVQYTILRPGDFVGEVSLTINQPRNASVRSLTVSTLQRMDKEDFDDACDMFPAERDKITAQTTKKNERNKKAQARAIKRASIIRASAFVPVETSEPATKRVSTGNLKPEIRHSLKRSPSKQKSDKTANGYGHLLTVGPPEASVEPPKPPSNLNNNLAGPLPNVMTTEGAARLLGNVKGAKQKSTRERARSTMSNSGSLSKHHGSTAGGVGLGEAAAERIENTLRILCERIDTLQESAAVSNKQMGVLQQHQLDVEKKMEQMMELWHVPHKETDGRTSSKKLHFNPSICVYPDSSTTDAPPRLVPGTLQIPG